MNLSWAEFLILVRRWQGMPHNALAESIAGHSVWSVDEQLTAYLFDAVAMQTWVMQKMQTKKNIPKPTPFPRPWDAKAQSFGREAIPYDEIDSWIKSTIREE